MTCSRRYVDRVSRDRSDARPALPRDTQEARVFRAADGREYEVLWTGADDVLQPLPATKAPDARRTGRIHGTGGRR